MRSERTKSQLRAEAKGIRRAKQVMARPAPVRQAAPVRTARKATPKPRPSRSTPAPALAPLRRQLAQWVLSRRTTADFRAVRLASGKPRSESARQKDLTDWARTQLGVSGGSPKQVKYARSIPIDPKQPWCSTFLAYGLRKQGKKPPANAAYSGAWLNWKGGKRVSKPRRGDLVVYDWGDGGLTDHVAIYEGRDRVIGGNQDNRVTRAPARLESAVGIVRPK